MNGSRLLRMRSGTDFAEAEPEQEAEEPCKRKKDITGNERDV